MSETINRKRERLEAARKEQHKAEHAVANRDAKARELDEAAAEARKKAEQAARDLKEAEQAELRTRLDAADAKVGETLASVLAGVARFADAVNAAREAQANADEIRRSLGFVITARDTVETVTLGALVDAGVVDARSVGIPVTTLRRLNPVRENERRLREEQERAAREEADRKYYEREDVIRHEIAILDRKIAGYRPSADKRSVRESLDEAVRQRDAYVGKLRALGHDFDEGGELAVVG